MMEWMSSEWAPKDGARSHGHRVLKWHFRQTPQPGGLREKPAAQLSRGVLSTGKAVVRRARQLCRVLETLERQARRRVKDCALMGTIGRGWGWTCM